MTHGVKYFVWRDGRPRWSPGANTRAKGFKGQDLKDADGDWLTMPEALKAAHDLNLAAGIISELPTLIDTPHVSSAAARRKGYVYFVLVAERVKIGFTSNPQNRLGNLQVGLYETIDLYVAVPGTQWDEHQVHDTLARHRLKGEWFEACQPVMNLLLRSVKARRIVLGKTAIHIDFKR